MRKIVDVEVYGPQYLFEMMPAREVAILIPFESMADAPDIGEIVEYEDVEWIRVLSTGVQARCCENRHFASKSLPFNYEPHARAGGSFNAAGEPVFDSWKQIRETTAAARHTGEVLTYDHNE